MPDTTANRGYPYGVLGDNIVDLVDVKPLADAIDADVQNLAAEILALRNLDSATNSRVLSIDVRCAQSDVTTILTKTFTLAEDQIVAVSAKARFEADNTSGAQGDVGIKIMINGSPAGSLADGIGQAGPGHVASFAASGRVSLAIPTFWIPLTAGSHTIDLVADRDGTGVVNASGDCTINGHTYNPTSLTITV